MNSTSNQKNIIVYSTPVCTYCHHLKDFLTSKGFTYEDIDVSKDFEGLKAAVTKSGQKGVPVIDIEGDIVVGFDQEAIEKLLGITK